MKKISKHGNDYDKVGIWRLVISRQKEAHVNLSTQIPEISTLDLEYSIDIKRDSFTLNVCI